MSEEQETKPFVVTPEIYQRSMEKIRIIEHDFMKLTGKPCKLMDMLSLSAVKEMKERADEYKKENPNWASEESSNKVEEVD